VLDMQAVMLPQKLLEGFPWWVEKLPSRTYGDPEMTETLSRRRWR
jgi:hypothetical protein